MVLTRVTLECGSPVYADLAADDPDFTQAVDAVRANASYCGMPAGGLAADPACNNHPYASHNVEGQSAIQCSVCHRD